MQISARAIGISAALCVILEEDGLATPAIAIAGKLLFWCGISLSFLCFANADVLRLTLGKIIGIGLLGLQYLLVIHLFRYLEDANFIILALWSLAEVVVFSLPFMVLRKWHTGIWY